MNHEILQSASWEQALSPALWKCGHCSPNPLAWFFFQALQFLHLYVLITTRLSTRGEPLQIFRVLPLCSSLFLQTQPVNSVHLHLPDSQLWLLNSVRLSRGSPSLRFRLEILQAVNWGNAESHCICFSSLGDHYPSLPDSQCLANYCFIYFVHFWLFKAGG